MARPPPSPTRQPKVCYRPIEAAIRLSGLARHEEEIVRLLKGRRLPEPEEFPQWPGLRFNAERIYDAILNRELRVAIDGIALEGDADLEQDGITIRHIDLKAWMRRHYPEERPRFLFSPLERRTSPIISVQTLQVLWLERHALKVRIEEREKELQQLRQQLRTPMKPATEAGASDGMLSERGETTYLNIVGGLLTLLLGTSPSGQPYSSFKSQEAIISALVALHGERLGIAQRTLEAKFAAAKRALAK